MAYKGLAIVIAAILSFAMLLPGMTTTNAYADTETISISSGDGPFFGPDSSITMLVGPQDTGFNVPLTPADFAAASSGPSAIVVPQHPAWKPHLAVDPAANYISTHAIHPNAAPATGTILSTALYAVDFEVPSGTVDSATLDFYFLVDNQLGDTANEGVFINGIPVPSTSGGSFGADNSFLSRDITSMVNPGTNTLYVLGVDVGGPSGLQFHADIDVEFTPAPATITLDATIRDFKAAHQPGGHIDFENGCCGNVLGIVQSTLGADGKPVYTSSGTAPTTHGAAAFNQWYNNVAGVNLSTTKTLTLTKISDSPLLYEYNNPAYFPIDNELFGNYAFGHNYHFTSEIHTEFTYESGQTFSFVGDDDVWVFINDKLVIDLGGVHGPAGGSVNLDSVATSIGIIPGNQYNLDIFQAERQTSGSTFKITTSIALVPVPQDTQPPTIDAEDFTAECNVSGGYDGSIPQATATDDVEVASLTNDAPSTFLLGQTTVTWTATDTSGNSATAGQLISVVDTTAPAIAPPADVTVTANTAGGFSGDTGTATATDICDDSVQVTNDAPGVFPLGDTTVTWTATDDSGNTATATQIVTATAVPVIIDVKPGSNVNPINVKEKGVIPVAILTTADFDATTVDPLSVSFGPGGASEAHAKGHIEDVDKDGDLDMVLHFEAQQAGISCGQTIAELVGQTLAGVPIAGSDSIKTVGCK